MELNKHAAAEKERTRIETWLKENTARKGSGKKLLFVLWDQPLTVAGAGTLPDSAIRLAGGINAAASEKGYFKCSDEFFLTAEFDGIVWALDKPYSLKRDLPLWRVPDPDLLQMVLEEAENRGYDVSKLIWVDQSRNIEALKDSAQ